MKLRDGQCPKCLSMGYCYFQKDCGRPVVYDYDCPGCGHPMHDAECAVCGHI